MAENPTYSHHDIVRYLQRQMTAPEMHAFEKALMDDPFLADALEGYVGSDPETTERHLAEIEDKLLGKRQQTPVVPLAPRRRYRMKVAAIVLLVATAGSAVLLLRKAPDPVPVVAEGARARPVLPERAVLPPALTDSTVVASTASPHAPARKHPGVSLPKVNPEASSQTDTIATTPVMSDLVADRAAGIYLQRSAGPLYRVRPDSSQTGVDSGSGLLHVFTGRVLDEKGDPVASATILNKQQQVAGVTDLNGHYQVRLPDTVGFVTVSSIGFSPVTTSLRNSQPDNQIRLQRDRDALPEVVTIGYGAARARRVKIDSAAGAEPVGGWPRFGQYLHAQIDSLQAKESPYHYNWENVALEFSIDADGRPYDIQVPRNVNPVAGQKAVDILTKGPSWKLPGKNKKVTVVIPFRESK